MRRSYLILVAVLIFAAVGCGDGNVADTTIPPTTAVTPPTRAVSEATTAPPATTSTTTTMPMSTTEAATTATTAPGSGWLRVTHDEAVLGGEGTQRMWGVAAGGPGFVAVGKDGHGTGDFAAAVWTSADGLNWSRVTPDEDVFGGGGNARGMWAVTAGGPGLVAVGDTQEGAGGSAAVWTSVDGLAWSRVPHAEEIFGGGGLQTMRSVTSGGPGLVAVGGDWSHANEAAAVWTSADGLTWSRVPYDEEVFGGDGAKGMWSVTAGGPGLVAVGMDTRGGHYENGAVWTSADGLTWSRVPHDDTVFSGKSDVEILGVTAGGPGLVAVGEDSSGPADAAVWTSIDGITWTRVPHDDAVFGGDRTQVMAEVTVGGPGLVAVGWDEGGERDAVVWISVDGLIWTRVHDDEAFGAGGTQAMLDVAAGASGVVAIGGDWSGGDWDPAVWMWPAP